MASNQTANYQLNQWEPEDKVLRTDFNADNLKIDGAIHAVRDEVTAEAAARGALAEVVAAQAAAIAKLGNCKIGNLTYTGTGTSGASNPTKIDFPAKPLLFIVYGSNTLLVGSKLSSFVASNYNGGIASCPLTWSGNQARIVCTLDMYMPYYQANAQGQTYYVFAFYNMEE